jgi:hypothetical protein
VNGSRFRCKKILVANFDVLQEEWLWVAKRRTKGSWFTRGGVANDKIDLVDSLLDVWRELVIRNALFVERVPCARDKYPDNMARTPVTYLPRQP